MKKLLKDNLLACKTEIAAIILILISIFITYGSLSAIHEMELAKHKLENSKLLMDLSRKEINIHKHELKLEEASIIIERQGQFIKQLIDELKNRDFTSGDAI